MRDRNSTLRLLVFVAAAAVAGVVGRVTSAEAAPVGVWSLESPNTAVPDALAASLTYDSSRHSLIRFGGFFAAILGDTWEWDGTTWTQECTASACRSHAPPPRSDHGAAFDSKRNRLVLYGGCGNTACSSPYLGDTWEWDGTSWTEMCTSAACRATTPGGRSSVSMVFDSVRERVVLFGGVGSDTFATGTWEWDGAQWTNACGTTCPAPAGRIYAGATFDSKRGVTLIQGGSAPSSAGVVVLGDLWSWDGKSWSELCTSASCMKSSPGPRTEGTLAFDSTRGVALLWGGCTNAGSTCTYPAPSVFAWNGSEWGEDAPATMDVHSPAPSVLSGQVWAFDDFRSRAVLLTAGADIAKTTNDTYVYYARGDACSSAGTCDTGLCANGACCEAACTDPCDVCDSATNPGVCTTRNDCVASCDGDHHVTSSDGKSSIDCSPYECDPGGTCKTSCTTPDDCASPNVCNGKDRCVAPPNGAPSTAPSGGCAMVENTQGGFIAFGLLAIALVRKRRIRA
jgi:hypothetical protein